MVEGGNHAPPRPAGCRLTLVRFESYPSVRHSMGTVGRAHRRARSSARPNAVKATGPRGVARQVSGGEADGALTLCPQQRRNGGPICPSWRPRGRSPYVATASASRRTASLDADDGSSLVRTIARERRTSASRKPRFRSPLAAVSNDDVSCRLHFRWRKWICRSTCGLPKTSSA